MSRHVIEGEKKKREKTQQHVSNRALSVYLIFDLTLSQKVISIFRGLKFTTSVKLKKKQTLKSLRTKECLNRWGEKKDTIKGPNKANENNERKEGKIFLFVLLI